MRSILLLFLAPLSLTVGSGLFIGMQYIFYGPNWATDIIGLAVGCLLAVTLTADLAKKHKKAWIAYAFSLCLAYSCLSWILVIFYKEESFIPLAFGSLIGAFWGLIQAKRTERPSDA